MSDIDYALVESTRPPIYTAMKYWGKKPHNIWREYIDKYTPPNGVFMDPFAGSGISIFEALKINRKAIGFDLNPLTSFFIEVLTSNFDEVKFKNTIGKIIQEVETDSTYRRFYASKSRQSPYDAIVQHCKWKNGNIYEIGLIDIDKNGIPLGERYLAKPNEADHQLAKEMSTFDVTLACPKKPFPDSPSFSASFIQKIGGNKFTNLWTNRNLYTISLLFKNINEIKDVELKNQVLSGFIQMLHLTSKMCVPRRNKANRAFSTSWGRSAYLCSSRSMEMNPLLVFKGSCLGKQSVESALKEAKSYLALNNRPKLKKVSDSNKIKQDNAYSIKYGAVDINSLDQYILDKSVDFIMTDPPYGGLVQYLDLSYIWLAWLEITDEKFSPNFKAEITIKKDKISEEVYQKRLTNAFKEIRRVLKDNGKVVFTFHNKKISVWNAFLRSIKDAGLKVEKVIHQQNKRTGEAVVANPYGTSGADFYIRCVKEDIMASSGVIDAKKIVLDCAIRRISERNEPTPYQILFNGIMADVFQFGLALENFDTTVESILKEKINEIFIIKDNHISKAGALWWLKQPKDHISYPDTPLTRRVEDTVLNLLRFKTSITFDEVLSEIFIKYPNGLIPDIKSVSFFLEKFATKSSGKWLYNREKIEKEISQHTHIIALLSKIAKNSGCETFIGKREQSEKIENKTLKDFANYENLGFLKMEKEITKRVEMIDMLWLRDGTITKAIEVENSTDMTSALQRGSNLNPKIHKIMVIPDKREYELNKIIDPMFRENFTSQNWKYLIYSDIEKLYSTSSPRIESFLKDLNYDDG